MKKTMMSMGLIWFAPTVPSCTSWRPIARIARRKRSAINGAVEKLMDMRTATKRDGVFLSRVFAVRAALSCLGEMMRQALQASRKAFDHGLGM